MTRESERDLEQQERVGLLSVSQPNSPPDSDHDHDQEAQRRASCSQTRQLQTEDKASARGEGWNQDGTPAICRICLEEDDICNLESPCGCAGTQRWAHHDCIQRWVSEKGNARCEICEQPYRGAFNVPPPPPPPGPIPVDNMPLLGPMFLMEGGRGGLGELGDDDPVYPRTSGVTWCFTFTLFFMFLLVLHHTLLVADGVNDYGGDGGASGLPDPSDPSGYGPDPGPGAAHDDYAASLTFFMFWVATKAFLIGVPLYTVMKVAARQAQREQYEVMMQRMDHASRLYRYGNRYHTGGRTASREHERERQREEAQDQDVEAGSPQAAGSSHQGQSLRSPSAQQQEQGQEQAQGREGAQEGSSHAPPMSIQLQPQQPDTAAGHMAPLAATSPGLRCGDDAV